MAEFHADDRSVACGEPDADASGHRVLNFPIRLQWLASTESNASTTLRTSNRSLTASCAALPMALSSARRFAGCQDSTGTRDCNASDFTVEQSVDVTRAARRLRCQLGVAIDPQQNIAAVTSLRAVIRSLSSVFQMGPAQPSL